MGVTGSAAQQPPGAELVTSLPPPTAQRSSELLRQSVAAFMARAARVSEHPLARTAGVLMFTLEFDVHTLALLGGQAQLDDVDEASWTHIAVLLRPIVFA